MKVQERELAVIETSVLVDGKPYMQQMVLLSEQELERVKQEYPSLVVRWAEQEDRKQWALSSKLFDDPKGPCRDMMILPDEVRDRLRLAKKSKRRG